MKMKLSQEEQAKQIEYCNLLTLTTRTAYDAIDRVFCQILQKNIVFNAKGFYHLRYKPDGTARTVAERIYKLSLFPLAVAVIKNAISIDEERNILIFENTKKGAKKIKAKQIALVATVGKNRPVSVRIIVIEFENSLNPIFWSIMKD